MSEAHTMMNVALRPWPASAKEALSKEELLLQITQLTTERGHLRAITEKALQEEIDAGEEPSAEFTEGQEEEKKKDTKTTKDKLEQIYRVRNEMATKLEWATFSAANALDLIAIILSKDPSKNLESAYSHRFKQQGVPPGSFGLDKSNIPERPGDKQRQAELVSKEKLVTKGSRMQALDWATDSLLKAATKLEAEVRKETKYWDEILSISNKGWSIQRTRKNGRRSPFAVRYGLPEASNHFKGRGLAPLLMNKYGGIILDPALTLKPKTLRVRISNNGEIVGASSLPPQSDIDEPAIEESIKLARESLFEEELFHEMSMETRQLHAYGVELRSSVLSLDAPKLDGRFKNCKLLIDCVPRNERRPADQNGTEDWLAQSVAEALRLFLAHEHHMRLQRRSQIPAPLTSQKRQQPTPPLLRTLLGICSHLNAVDSLHAYLETLVKTVGSAGLDIVSQTSRETSWVQLTNIIEQSNTKDLSAIDQLLQTFTRPFQGTATISLPSSGGAQTDNITIVSRTYIGPPHFGTEHKLTLPSSLVSVLNLSADQQRHFKMTSTEDVKSYVDFLLSLDISHTLLVKEYDGRAVIKSKEPRVSIFSSTDKKGSRKESDVSVELENGILKLTASTHEDLETRSAVWKGASNQVSLKEVVKSWVKQ